MASPHSNNKIALLCTIHASSTTSRDKILTSLKSASTDYYRDAKSQCTTWTYFQPSTRPKAPSQLIAKDKKDVVIGGLEIYTDKQALSSQQQESWFKEHERRAKSEHWYEKDEELVVWYPTAGFVSRDDSTQAGQGKIVMLAVFTCKEGKRDAVVDVISKYTEYVKREEDGVLTYCTMTRPKAPNQVLLFERYRDVKALGAHGGTKEFKAMFKGIAPNIEVKQTKLQEFTEINASFVGNVPGQKSQVSSKL